MVCGIWYINYVRKCIHVSQACRCVRVEYYYICIYVHVCGRIYVYTYAHPPEQKAEFIDICVDEQTGQSVDDMVNTRGEAVGLVERTMGPPRNVSPSIDSMYNHNKNTSFTGNMSTAHK